MIDIEDEEKGYEKLAGVGQGRVSRGAMLKIEIGT